jgi:Subtilase family
MASIADQDLPIPELPAEYKRRVVVKFKPDTQPSSSTDIQELTKSVGLEWEGLSKKFPGIKLDRYFTTFDEPSLTALSQRASNASQRPTPVNFGLYYAVECPAGVEPGELAKDISAWSNVEVAYVEGGPVPPPLNPADDPRSANQGYLDAAPSGIDARWAWENSDGTGVGFVDLERGWTLNHEDLAAANINVISGVNQDFHGHGTAVLGEVVAVDNNIGGIGISPGATARVVSQWRTPVIYNTAEAILSAVATMNTGDVLLLEAQTSYPTVAGYVPVEVEPAVFDAIQFATSQGITVVEAGANGSVDLDVFQDLNGKQVLNRNSPDFQDSGAIIVGAASSTVPHQRLSFSNFGSRIDCFAWGQNIDTSGDGWTGTATNAYTTSFGGTSGASPIIAGAALLMQSWRTQQNNNRYTPSELRALLSDVTLNTPSADPTSDRIGVMPDLRAHIESPTRLGGSIRGFITLCGPG